MSTKQKFPKKDTINRGILRDAKSFSKTNKFSEKKKVKFTLKEDSLNDLEGTLRCGLLEAINKQLNKENEMMKEDCKIMEGDNKFLNIEYAKLNSKFELLDKNCRNFEDNNDFLNNEYVKLRGENQDLESEIQDLLNIHNGTIFDYNNLKRKYEDLDEYFVNTKSNLNSEIEALKLKIFVLEQTNDKYSRENNELIWENGNFVSENEILREMNNSLRNEETEEGELKEEPRNSKKSKRF